MNIRNRIASATLALAAIPWAAFAAEPATPLSQSADPSSAGTANYWWTLVAVVVLVVITALILSVRQGSSIGDTEDSLAARLMRQRIKRATTSFAVVVMILLAVVVFSVSPPVAKRTDIVEIAFVALLSGAVAYAELSQRYKDDPLQLMTGDFSIVYICVNIAAGIGALSLVKAFNVLAPPTAHSEIYQTLLASFGSIAFFRSSIFTARVGGNNVDIGPSTLLKGLLDTSDRMINRAQAKDRADQVGGIMADVNFEKAKGSLPTLCFTLVENVAPEDQKAVADSIVALSQNPQVSNGPSSSIILGVYLMRIVGPSVLRRAVRSLGDDIKGSGPAPNPPQVPPAPVPSTPVPPAPVAPPTVAPSAPPTVAPSPAAPPPVQPPPAPVAPPSPPAIATSSAQMSPGPSQAGPSQAGPGSVVGGITTSAPPPVVVTDPAADVTAPTEEEEAASAPGDAKPA